MTSPLRLGADVGELPDRVYGNDEDRLIALLDDASVACGGHAGDDDTMRRTVARCVAHGVAIGAHPSYPDREGFGRRRLDLDPSVLRASLLAQVRRLLDVAGLTGAPVTFLKPHGALYHAVDDDPGVAAVLADVVEALAFDVGARLPVVLLGAIADNTPSRALLHARGVTVRREVFADRGTDDAGRLLPRGMPGAVLDGDAAATLVQRLLKDGVTADVLCLHGDSPGALDVARAVRAVLDGTRDRADP